MSLINQHGRGSQRLEIPRKGYYILPNPAVPELGTVLHGLCTLSVQCTLMCSGPSQCATAQEPQENKRNFRRTLNTGAGPRLFCVGFRVCAEFACLRVRVFALLAHIHQT
jgi:hypothetical protein